MRTRRFLRSVGVFGIVLVVCCSSLFSRSVTDPLKIKYDNKRLEVSLVKDKCEHCDLVDMKKFCPEIEFDIIYATEDNICKQVLYSSAKCYLRRHVAQALKDLQQELKPHGLGLKIWDGFRTMKAQDTGYKLFPNLFAKPNKERARHPRGTAVDITLTVLDKDGKYLEDVEMPTGVDDLTEKAKLTYNKVKKNKDDEKGISAQAKHNREVLAQLMTKHGFEQLASEWWHFDHWSWKQCPVIDLTFEKVKEALDDRDGL